MADQVEGRGQGGPEGSHLLRRADRDPKPSVRADLTDQHAMVEDALPDRVPVGERAEQHEVRVGLRDVEALVAQPRSSGVALGTQVGHPGEQLDRHTQRDRRHRLRDRGEVVGQAHDPQGVDEGLAGREVADPATGERERLRHRPGDGERREVVEQGEGGRCAVASELGVRLVDHDDPGRCRADRLDHVESERRARRVVGRGQQDDVGPLLLDQREGVVELDAEVVVASTSDPAGRGVAGVLRVHRVRRGERQGRTLRAAERLQDVQHDLVGAVGGPDPACAQPVPEVRRQAPHGARVASRSG